MIAVGMQNTLVTKEILHWSNVVIVARTFLGTALNKLRHMTSLFLSDTTIHTSVNTMQQLCKNLYERERERDPWPIKAIMGDKIQLLKATGQKKSR